MSERTYTAALKEVTSYFVRGELPKERFERMVTPGLLGESKAAALMEMTLFLNEMEQPDPRPDLEVDTLLWAKLLRLVRDTREDPEGLYGALRGMRCCGARLDVDARGATLVLSHGEMSPDEYAVERAKRLAPHKPRLIEALRHAAALT